MGIEYEIRVGTSGWSYDHWKNNFYPSDLPNQNQLQYYAENFSTVEVNNTFYQLPSKKAIRNWVRSTPENFSFAVKASRYITHMKNLLDPQESTEKFFELLPVFGNKLGPILFQLPGRWQVNIQRLENFLDTLPRKFDYVMELRHESWFNEKIYDVLRQNDVALCFQDISGSFCPLVSTSKNLIYVRFHGPNGNYSNKYSKSTLDKWISLIHRWQKKDYVVYAYFNNDTNANAVENGLYLKKKLSQNL